MQYNLKHLGEAPPTIQDNNKSPKRHQSQSLKLAHCQLRESNENETTNMLSSQHNLNQSDIYL